MPVVQASGRGSLSDLLLMQRQHLHCTELPMILKVALSPATSGVVRIVEFPCLSFRPFDCIILNSIWIDFGVVGALLFKAGSERSAAISAGVPSASRIRLAVPQPFPAEEFSRFP